MENLFKAFRKPTALYGLQLLRTDAGDPESLFSYLLRLAFAHRVTPKKLEEGCLNPSFLAMFGRVPNATQLGHSGAMILGNSRTALDFSGLLSSLTGARDLHRGTGLALRHLVGTQGLITERDRVCLSCIREDLSAGRTAFGRLIWRLSSVTCCPVHREALTDVGTCPKRACHPGSPYRPVKLYGVCGMCASVGYHCHNADNTASGEQIDLALLCRDFFAAHPIDEQSSASATKRSLREASARINGGYAAIARSANISKSILGRWLNHDDARLALGTVLALCVVLGVSAQEFARGDFARVDGQPGRTINLPRKSKRKLVTADLAAAVRDALNSERKIVAEVARELQVDRNMLRRADPEAYSMLSRRGVALRIRSRDARWDAAIGHAHVMITRLRNSEKTLSLKNASAEDEGVWTPSQRRSQIFLALARSDPDRLSQHYGFPLDVTERVRAMLSHIQATLPPPSDDVRR
ncbi:TniQ family protein [Pseudorhodoferax sp. Leaf265]|uniref:TniQ family protein n=1 Tax=Pseudorhodoferax sp. Leaf265 TaxID=1736315 RepID=UPI0009E90B00|nr:TniQ family protein [Pseudorhodoferax sp. Leaf265]